MCSRREMLRYATACLSLPATAMAKPARLLPVPMGYRLVAMEKAVPATLLYAIALQESGRLHGLHHHRVQLPWPWALNIAGHPYLAATRQQAERRLQQALAMGIQSTDIGICQLNWRHHGHRFSSPGAALDPYVNLRAAADLLRELYSQSRDWWVAAGHYHSPANATRAAAYRQSVQRYWGRIQHAL